MGLRAWLGEEGLPQGYDVLETPRGALAVLAPYHQLLVDAGLGPDGSGEITPSNLAGRRPLGEITHGDERLVVRTFHHGGLLRWLTGDRFGDPGRPFRELILAHRLAQQGVRTPTVVAARAQRHRLFGWKLALVTLRVEGATEVSHVLDRIREEGHSERVAAHLFQLLGSFVGELHAVGFHHTDLTPRNLLVGDEVLARGDAALWVLDLDRCSLRDLLTEDERVESLARLLRYVVRRDPREGGILSRTRLARFLRAYGARASEAGAPATLGNWRVLWRRLAHEAKRGAFAHRMGWAVEERFGGGPETRDGRARA